MRDVIFPVRHNGPLGLQAQLRRHLVDAILDGRLSAEEPLPSCRRLAKSLGVSRNTVVLAYQVLADEGFLISRERVGYFVNRDMAYASRHETLGQDAEGEAHGHDPDGAASEGPGRQSIEWWSRLVKRPSSLLQITKPKSWRRYPYPFIYGQCDPNLFPVTAWRNCSRMALSLEAIETWSEDSFDEDDPLLIEEVRARVLPRRGIRARADEILVTLGAQNAIYLIAELLMAAGSRVGVEDPGYVDARNIFVNRGAELVALPVDHQGLIVDRRLDDCDVIYITPSHQSPTTVTMARDRRDALMVKASEKGFLVIEDDYEAEANFTASPSTALKALDRDGRVIYVGSFSKYLAPGLRMGFIVASPDLIREVRDLRRLVLRHPPTNNQRTVALFVGGGYYDALMNRLQRTYQERWTVARKALRQHLPNCSVSQSSGGTSFWVSGPEELDADVLARDCLARGIVIEPGSVHYIASRPPRNHLRLGFSSIKADRIEPGVRLLAEVLAGHLQQ